MGCIVYKMDGIVQHANGFLCLFGGFFSNNIPWQNLLPNVLWYGCFVLQYIKCIVIWLFCIAIYIAIHFCCIMTPLHHCEPNEYRNKNPLLIACTRLYIGFKTLTSHLEFCSSWPLPLLSLPSVGVFWTPFQVHHT
jgi:hypothetical protein